MFAATKRRVLTTSCITLVTYHFGTGCVQSVFKDVMFIIRRCGQSHCLKDLEEEYGRFLCGGSGKTHKERSKVMKYYSESSFWETIPVVGLFVLAFYMAWIMGGMGKQIENLEQKNHDQEVQLQKAHEEREQNPIILVVSQIEYGIASWYGEPEHGQRMANGEIYDMHELHTAAHSRLPLGTIVLVTNSKNKKSVVVQINDRLPKVWNKKGRIVDMSYAAAKELEMVRDGLVSVELKVIKTAEDLTPEFLHERRGIFETKIQ